MAKRVAKVHRWMMVGGTACGSDGLLSSDDAKVTCNRCLYQLFAVGLLPDRDPRITSNMRARKSAGAPF